MTKQPQHYLIITAQGSQESELLALFTRLTKQTGCNILASKWSIWGQDGILSAYVAGSWNTIAKLETALPALAKQHQFQLHTQRTVPQTLSENVLYQAQVYALDKPGILNELTHFFKQRSIFIEEIDSKSYYSKNQSRVTDISFILHMSPSDHLASVREAFMTLCEELNFDGALEPLK